MSWCNARRLQTAMLVAIPALLVACQLKTPDANAPGTDHAKTARTEQTASVDEQRKGNDWKRMKECAEQADRFIKQPDPLRNQLGGWENHYSPKYNRCYVAITYLNAEAKKNPKLPLTFDVLYDAFEGRMLVFCGSNSPACLQEINDHLQN